MKLKIITTPNPILKRKSKKITKIDKKVIKFIKNLEDTLLKKKDPPGIGLSAPQVGKNWSVFSVQLPQENISGRKDLKDHQLILKTYLNPQIITASKKLTLSGTKAKPFLEGCLSIPLIYAPVYRHEWIKLKYSTINDLRSTIQKTEKFSGFKARVIQHELDHLDGILFTDRSIKQKLPLYKEEQEKLVKINL